MGHMLMKRDHVLRIVLLATHPGLTSHGSVTHFALCNTFMIAAPWRLSKLLLFCLYTNGIPVLTLHDGVQAQLQLAANRSPFSTSQLESHFRRYRHKYEYLVPTLKFVSSSTFFTNFLQPLSWEELEAREGSLGSSYHSDLLDLLFAFLSTMDAVPTPHFPASPEAVTPVLVQGCHHPPRRARRLVPLALLSLMKLLTNITNVSLSFLCDSLLLLLFGVPLPDVLAIEEAVRHILLRCSLPQALDFLHTQLLAGICVANPVRDSLTTHPSPPSCMLPYFSPSSFTRGCRCSPVSLLDNSPYLSQHGSHQSQM